MKLKKKISLLLVILILLFTVVTPLTSCTFGDRAVDVGSEIIYTKEELSANVSSAAELDFEYVWEYLNEWKFPVFDKTKLRRTEKLFRDYYYEEIPSSYEVARTVANDFLENSYDKIDLKDSRKVTDTLLTSLVNTVGDRYSYYRTNEQYQDYTDNMSGTKPTFYGIGVNVQTTLVDGGILVIKPIRNSPAEKAGVLADDIIIAINGTPVAESGYEAAVESIKGESGTDVVITVKRGEENIDITVTRGPIVEPTVDYTLSEDGIGYIDIDSFKKTTDEDFIEAINYMKENGAKVLIYDVRGNGGGYLDTVVNMLDYIAPDGLTLASFSNDYASAEKSRDGHSLNIPTVILCNGSSASASELFTVGMLDLCEMGYFPVVAVGQTTYGKFVMQNTFTHYDDSAVTLTVAYYYSPLGKQFNGEGIEPSVVVNGENAQLEAAYTEAKKLLENK